MSLALLIAGILLCALIALDIIKTALSTQGGGLLTDALSRWIWAAFFYCSGKRGDSRRLRYCGQAILVTIIACWILGLWLGFFLLLLSDTHSVVNASTLWPADAWEKFYYAGFSLSTLGVGDFQAASDGWRVLTSVAAFSGLVFITTAITYFVPVLSAVSLQKQLSLYISAMGHSPQQMLINCWTGKDFGPFYDNAATLCQMIMKHTMDHHAYPVVRYFHTTDPALNVVPALVMLDEARQLLARVVGEDGPEHHLQLCMLETALEAYLEMVQKHFIGERQPVAPAPVPRLVEMAEAGLPLRDGATDYLAEPAVQQRRRQLGVLLEQDGWSWQQVYPD